MQLVNWTLVKHPINWLTVGLMLFLAAIAGTLALNGLGHSPATSDSGSEQ